MFDFLIDNIFIVIIAAVVIVVRILNARRKRDESSSAENRTPLESDEEPRPALGHWETEKKAPVYSAKSRPKASTSQHLSRRDLEPLSPANDNAAAVSYAPANTAQKTVSQNAIPKTPFPQNLDYLPAFKKAIVLSEILSPPKALREE